MSDERLMSVSDIIPRTEYTEIVLSNGKIVVAFADEVRIGRGTVISPNIEIGMPGKEMTLFQAGDYCRLFAGQYASRRFVIGDYGTVHEGVWAYGRNDIVIGHNCWFGRRCTLDAEGGVQIGNGFGAGQDTHMWSHIRHGDVVYGSKYLSFGKFIADDDVWLVGRCTSAPAHHESRSMAMVESNLTKGMPENTIWGGNPAKDLTEKLGRPFVDTMPGDRLIRFNEYLDSFMRQNEDVDFMELSDLAENFDVETRTYQKTNSGLEVRLMRFLLPEVKFTPR